jgi:glucuronate isomerase
MSSLQLDSDRALPFPAEQRNIAREIYGNTKDLPLICMHGHVEPEVFADDTPFADPAQLLIVLITTCSACSPPKALSPLALGCHGSMGARSRLTHGRSGVRSARTGSSSAARRSRYWLEHELVEVFGVDLVPSAETADAIYDQIAACVADPAFRHAHCSTASTSRSSRRRIRLRRTCSTMRSLPQTVWASAFFQPSGRRSGLP